MNIRQLAIFSVLFVSTSNIACAQASVNISMVKEGGVWMLSGKVNGAPMKFVFDPGAADVSISLTEARYLLKNGLMSSTDIIDFEKYQTASGEIEVGWKIYLRELEVGGLKLTNVQASIVNSPSAPLLLGQTALSRLGVLTEDFNAGRLVIVPFDRSTYVGDIADGKVGNVDSNVPSRYASDYYKKLPRFSGKVSVCSYSPLLQMPNMAYSPIVGMAEDGVVTIIRQENEKYYYVRGNNSSGYLWVGWIKQ